MDGLLLEDAGGEKGTECNKGLRHLHLSDVQQPAALQAAHPAAAPAAPLEAMEPALQLASEQLQEGVGILSAHHRGTAAGHSAWAFKKICAACQSSDAALDVTLDLVNLILSGELPRGAFLLERLLIGLENAGGGGRPIAISETWYRFAGVCSTCPRGWVTTVQTWRAGTRCAAC